jgi:hypothetical protein
LHELEPGHLVACHLTGDQRREIRGDEITVRP